MSIKDVHILVKDKFDVYYSLKQIMGNCKKIGVQLQQNISKIFKITRRC